MPDRGNHCPFLNRTDARCSAHFSLDALGHAFDYCFGYYEGCGVYAELLAERRVRRSMAHQTAEYADHVPPHPASVVQVTVAGRVPIGAADPPLVSHAPRF